MHSASQAYVFGARSFLQRGDQIIKQLLALVAGGKTPFPFDSQFECREITNKKIISMQNVAAFFLLFSSFLQYSLVGVFHLLLCFSSQLFTFLLLLYYCYFPSSLKGKNRDSRSQYKLLCIIKIFILINSISK